MVFLFFAVQVSATFLSLLILVGFEMESALEESVGGHITGLEHVTME